MEISTVLEHLGVDEVEEAGGKGRKEGGREVEGGSTPDGTEGLSELNGREARHALLPLIGEEARGIWRRRKRRRRRRIGGRGERE